MGNISIGKKGRIHLQPDPVAWVKEALKNWPVTEAFLTAAIATRSQELDLPYEDPADRFIAANTLIYGFELMIFDERLCAATWLPTVES
ncbi:MAG: hypothetical protein GTN74_00620 [Proteobacteria bacterium]|nr:hypothetical protein [Pseudomonadota bacterium]NIS67517.1 hypothetical protein [Pseudomonadota bacterium]